MPSFPTIKPGDPQGLVFESPPESVESFSPWSDFCLREIESLRVESDGKFGLRFLPTSSSRRY
jgi:hypothetical protein